ncbi:MAG: hypothetical protein JXQ80_03805 [Bacteroidales bacterium]|nr:hypothetical protein [Bacteroidales bacterium]
MSESIKLVVKQKSIPTLVDFCLEEKIEFIVRPQAFPDTDWEFNLMVKDIKTAVLTGMFLRENRLDVAGNEQPKPVKKAPVKKSKEEDEKTPAPANEPAAAADEAKTPEGEDKGLF